MAKKSGFTIVNCIIGVVTVVAACTIGVQSGAYAGLAPYLGLTPVSSVEGIKPGADSQQRNDLGLHLDLDAPAPQTPTTPDTGEATDTDSGTGAGEDTTRTDDTATDTGADAPAAQAPITPAQALDLLDGIRTATPHTAGYDRETQFGTWANSDDLCGTGTTRDLILQRDMSDVTMDGQCRVQSGTLHDPYTGTSVSFERSRYANGKLVSGDSGRVQIDHVVALQDAWASGLWKDARAGDRKTYANDPDVLLAVDGDANNEKSMGVNLYGRGVAKTYNGKGSPLHWQASTPSVWLPVNTGYQCAYLSRRVYIKDKYALTMSDWEKRETRQALTQCSAA